MASITVVLIVGGSGIYNGIVSHPSQEVASGKRVMCGTVVLNAEPGALQSRVGNALCESCRGGSAVLPNFPEFGPVVKALQENNTSDQSVVYKVCVAKCGRLLVLQSLARRWTEYEGTKDEANSLIVEHNKGFNPDGDYMEDDERPWVPKKTLIQIKVRGLQAGWCPTIFRWLLAQPLCPSRPSTTDAAERPAKKIKLSDFATCTEADISSLTKPNLSCIGFFPSFFSFSDMFVIHPHVGICVGFPAICFFSK